MVKTLRTSTGVELAKGSKSDDQVENAVQPARKKGGELGSWLWKLNKSKIQAAPDDDHLTRAIRPAGYTKMWRLSR